MAADGAAARLTEGGALAELAPAKINLCLHVTGRRADGYHLLDSLVAFAGLGDRVEAAPASRLGLVIDGPFALDLDAGPDNLVLRAAVLMGGRGAAIRLTKSLPVAAGIGGGSADAAATLRLLGRLWQQRLPDRAALMRLGADVPVCLTPVPQRMRGAGERTEPVPLPPAWVVLVNPGVPVPTARVFAGLVRRSNPPLPDSLPRWPDATALARWLAAQRNDLAEPALALAPAIAPVLAAVSAQPGCLIARLSGSGATCFGLFADAAPALAAARALGATPGWWAAAGPLLPLSPSAPA